MRRGVPGHGEVLLALPENFVHHRGGQPIGAKTAHGQVIAVLNQGGHGLRHRHAFIGEGAVLAGEEIPGLISGGVGVKFAERRRKRIHSGWSMVRGEESGIRSHRSRRL